MSRAFPDAPIYTLLYDPAGTYPEFADRDVRVSPLNRLAFFRKHHRAALPLLPRGRVVDVRRRRRGGDQQQRLGARFPDRTAPSWCTATPRRTGSTRRTCTSGRQGDGLKRGRAEGGRARLLKAWDRRAARTVRPVPGGVDDDQGPHRRRLRHRRGRAALAGGDAHRRRRCRAGAGRRRVGDRRTSRSTCACPGCCPTRTSTRWSVPSPAADRRLVVVGRGPEAGRIEPIKTPNVAMLSDLTDAQMAWLYQSCRALIAASYEDYGLTPIEAGGVGQARGGAALGRLPGHRGRGRHRDVLRSSRKRIRSPRPSTVSRR